MSTLAKELSQLTIGAGGYRIQLFCQVTHTTNAKSLTSQHNARTRSSGIKPGPLNTWCYNQPLRKSYDSTTTSRRKMIIYPYNTTTTLTPTLQRPSSHSVPMITLVTLIIIVPTPRKVSNSAPLILCPGNIIPRACQTDISITSIPLKSAFLLFGMLRAGLPMFSFGWWVRMGVTLGLISTAPSCVLRMRRSEIVKVVSINVAQDRWGISAQYKEGWHTASDNKSQIASYKLQNMNMNKVCANIRSLSLRV
jgi:hypothetical protein